MLRIFIFCLLSIVLLSCSTKPKEEAVLKVEVNELPFLPLKLMSGEVIDAHSLSGNSILILFFTDCDHCQREATAIAERMEAFKKYNLYFISSNTPEQIIQFSSNYKLADFSNVKFAQAETGNIIRTFGAIPTPSVYIYSAERRLVKQFNGETNIEEIIKFL